MSAFFPFLNYESHCSQLYLKFSCHLNFLLLSERVVNHCSWAGNWLLTSISHHYFLDGPVHRLRCGVGEAGENAGPPHSQQADATLDCDVLQHPRRQREVEIEHPKWTLWVSRSGLVQSGTKKKHLRIRQNNVKNVEKKNKLRSGGRERLWWCSVHAEALSEYIF